MRAAASKGSADLFMGKTGRVPILVQVGTAKSKSLGPGERARFLHHSDLARADPIVARTHPGLGITYHRALLTPESTWTEWTP